MPVACSLCSAVNAGTLQVAVKQPKLSGTPKEKEEQLQLFKAEIDNLVLLSKDSNYIVKIMGWTMDTTDTFSLVMLYYEHGTILNKMSSSTALQHLKQAGASTGTCQPHPMLPSYSAQAAGPCVM